MKMKWWQWFAVFNPFFWLFLSAVWHDVKKQMEKDVNAI